MEAPTAVYLMMGFSGLVAVFWWERRTARKARRRREAMKRCIKRQRLEAERR